MIKINILSLKKLSLWAGLAVLYCMLGSSLVSAQTVFDLKNQNSTTQAGGTQTNIDQEMKNRMFFNPDLGDFIVVLVDFALVFGAISTLIYMIWGGIEYVTSGGEQTKYQSARNKIMYAIVGLGILAVTFVLWLILLHFLGLSNSDKLILPALNLGGGSSNTTNPPYNPPPDQNPNFGNQPWPGFNWQ